MVDIEKDCQDIEKDCQISFVVVYSMYFTLRFCLEAHASIKTQTDKQSMLICLFINKLKSWYEVH